MTKKDGNYKNEKVSTHPGTYLKVRFGKLLK